MQISERALKFRCDQREKFLRRVCNGKQSLRKEVDVLIQSIDDSGSFMKLEVDESEV